MKMSMNQIDAAAKIVDKLEIRLGGMLDEQLHADLIAARDILAEVRVFVNGLQESCMLMAPLSLGGQAMPRDEAKKIAQQYGARFEQFVGVSGLF